MSKKLYFLISFVLVLALSGLAQAGTPIDVNNHSFEYNCDGEQIQREVPPRYGCIQDWVASAGAEWVGASIWCGSPLNELDPGETGCSGTEASDGHVSGWAGAKSGDVYMYQVVDANFEPNMLYTLLFDGQGDPLENAGFRPQFFYGTDPELNLVASEAFRAFDERGWFDPNIGWEGWTYDLAVQFAAKPGAPCVGQPIGIRLFMPYEEPPDYTPYPFFDNLRLSKDWATCAYDPHPHSQEPYVDTSVTLDWSPGLWVDKHIVYFSSSFADVNSRTEDANQGWQDANEFVVPGSLSLSQTYYWAIDEVNDNFVPGPNLPPAGPWLGPVWSFKTKPGKAYGFIPGDGAEDVARDVNLSWTAGPKATWHVVYFSSSFADVNSRAEDANQGWLSLDNNSFDPTPGGGQLALGQTYYWAVDEVNILAVDIGSPWRSDVLRFTSRDYIVVEDFDSYVDKDAIRAVWKDYYTGTLTGNGAEVFVETVEGFVRDGNSMRFAYRNYNTYDGNYVGSEAEADIANLEIGPDWTASGVKALVLYFYGDLINGTDHDSGYVYPITVDQMYVAVEDGSSNVGIVKYPDMNAIKEAEWQEWNIDLAEPCLADVNMANVAKVYIGFGGQKTGQSVEGAGNWSVGYDTVWFDDISLYPPRCRPEIAHPAGSFDYDDDCVVDYRDVHVLGGDDWLVSSIGMVTATTPSDTNLMGHWTMDDDDPQLQVDDSSVKANHGTLYDEDRSPGRSTAKHHTDDCAEGTGALTFDGDDDYIEIPVLDLNSNTVTVSAWIKRDGEQTIYAGIVDCHYSDPCDSNVPGTFFGIDIGSGGTYGFMQWGEWEINHELCYLWGDIDLSAYDYDYSYDFHTGLIVPDKLWTFVALSVGPTEATLYLDDGTFQGARLNAPHNPIPFNGPARFGDQMQFGEKVRMFKGAMDDVRIYDYTLTPGEILYLSQGAASNAYVTLPMGRPDGDGDNKIDLKDYSVMANNWLKEILWPAQP